MTYKLIKDLAVNDQLEQICLVDKVEAKTTKKSKPFTRVFIKDRSGTLGVNIWQFGPEDMSDLKSGTFAVFKLKVEDFNGSKSASATPPMVVKAPEDLTPYQNNHGLSEQEAKAYYKTLMDAKDKVKNIYIKTYLDAMFGNPTLEALFFIAPASVTNRGAYRGGLVEHVSKVMMNAEAIIKSQSTGHIVAPVDLDLVIAGVLVHDVGKVFAYTIDDNGMAQFTRSGHLLEHLPMSYGVSVQAFIHAESILHKQIPDELKDHINHIILSHHGQLAYGSPVTPKSLEAQIVHIADMADSTVSNYAEPTKNNAANVDEDGFVEGTRFSSRQLFIGTNNG